MGERVWRTCVLPEPFDGLTTPYHAAFWANALEINDAGGSVADLSRSLASARVDLNPHQVDAALFAIRSPLSKGVILADEVGLGKTIEAGLVLAQRWAERRRRILLIVPASLRKQWQEELRQKFGLPAIIIDGQAAAAERASGRERPFGRHDEIVITSYQFAAARADDVTRLRVQETGPALPSTDDVIGVREAAVARLLAEVNQRNWAWVRRGGREARRMGGRSPDVARARAQGDRSSNRRDRRASLASATLVEKLAAQRSLKALESERAAKQRALYDAQDRSGERRGELIASIERQLGASHTWSEIFVIRWRLA